MTRVTSCVTSNQLTDSHLPFTDRSSRTRLRPNHITGTAMVMVQPMARALNQRVFASTWSKSQSTLFCPRSISSYMCVHISLRPWSNHSEIQFHPRARSANERQNTPRINGCPAKNESVIFRSIQQPRNTEIFLTVLKFETSTDITQLIQQKHSPFKLIALSGS